MATSSRTNTATSTTPDGQGATGSPKGKRSEDKRRRAKRWTFTLNNPLLYPDGPSNKGLQVPLLWKQYAEYCVWQYEAGEKKETPHLQGYIIFKKRVRLPFLKRLSRRAHWQVAIAGPKKNYEYCTKQKGQLDGPWEFGERPYGPGERERKRWDSARISAISGKDLYSSVPADIHIRYESTLKRMQREKRAKPQPLRQLANEWHFGPSGLGKTSYIYNKYIYSGNYGDGYIKALDKWWDNYDGEDNVIIDDISDESKYRISQIKNWADYYPYNAQPKGGSMIIRPKRIIVSSNCTLEQVSTDRKTGFLDVRQFLHPLQRRFKYYDWSSVETRPKDWFIYASSAEAKAIRKERHMTVPWETEDPVEQEPDDWLKYVKIPLPDNGATPLLTPVDEVFDLTVDIP